MDFDQAGCYQEMGCLVCELTYFDEYQLTGYSVLKEYQPSAFQK